MKQEYIYNGFIKQIVDGDTIVIMIDLGFHVLRVERFRLARINTPELKDHDEKIKQKAMDAKQYLVGNYLGSQCTIKSLGQDKYGRYVAEVLLKDGTNLSDQMLKECYAVEYKK